MIGKESWPQRIGRCFAEDRVLYSQHARKEMLAEEFGAIRVLFATDLEGENVRVVTAYRPRLEEWEADLKTRRRYE